MKPIVSLRSAGDIIALLPLLRHIAVKHGSPASLIVHEKYADILDGVSYVKPIIWTGDSEDPLAAAKRHDAINAQTTGRSLSVSQRDRQNQDFAKIAWSRLGYIWNRHWTLSFDRRNAKREKKLRDETFKTGLPKILVKLHGLSSPFSDREKLKKLLVNEFSQLAEIVWLDNVKAERIYDMIGLLDSAACLVSIDTVMLWLAKASKCPVVALVNSEPFLASPPSGNVLARIPYSNAISKWDDIARVIHSTLWTHEVDDMVLVYNDFKSSDPNVIERQDRAMKTWKLLPCRQYSFPAERTSALIGDKRKVPFIRDMINGAISTGSESVIAITNTDISFDAKLYDKVMESCKEFGCYWAYRAVDSNKETDYGADFFAFTRAWWFQHEHLYPDLILGYYWWDDVFVRMMRWCGCTEMERLYYHESHPGQTATDRIKSVGGAYAQNLALEWIKNHYELNQKPEQ